MKLRWLGIIVSLGVALGACTGADTEVPADDTSSADEREGGLSSVVDDGTLVNDGSVTTDRTAAEETESNSITIQTAGAGRPFDHRLLGTNVPAWLGPDLLADEGFQEQTVASGTSLLRFPGGSWSNSYSWEACERRDAVGCFWTWAARPSDFAAFMNATGLPAMWTVSINGTAEEAAALVAFFNGETGDDRLIGTDRHGRDWGTIGQWAELRVAGGNNDPSRIDLWEIGNEVFAAKPEAGSDCASFGWEDVWTCDGTEYVVGNADHDGFRRMREAMLGVDPTIAVGAVGVAEQQSWGAWGAEVIDSLGADLDFYVVHHYGFTGAVDPKIAIETATSDWPRIMADVETGLSGSHVADDVDVAVTEYNMVAVQENDTGAAMRSQLGGLYIAATIGAMAENGVDIANQWNLANGVAPNGTDYGMIDVDTGQRNPAFYALALWSRFGDEMLPVTFGADVDRAVVAYAGRHSDGSLSILIVNGTNQEQTANFELASVGSAVRFDATADAVTSSSNDSSDIQYNGVSNPSVGLTEPPTQIGVVGPMFSRVLSAASLSLIRLRFIEDGADS